MSLHSNPAAVAQAAVQHLDMHFLLELNVHKMRLCAIRLPVCVWIAIAQKLDAVPRLGACDRPDGQVPYLTHVWAQLQRPGSGS